MSHRCAVESRGEHPEARVDVEPEYRPAMLSLHVE